MNKTAKYIAIIFAVIIVVLLGILAFVNPPQKGAVATNIVSSASVHPTSPDGRVEIFDPMPDQTIISPESVSGNVTGGGWFFEGTFPVKIVDGDGTVLGQGPVRAQSDWTSTGTVSFTGTIVFLAPHSATGTIVFSKDNPSDMAQNEVSFGVPVRFR